MSSKKNHKMQTLRTFSANRSRLFIPFWQSIYIGALEKRVLSLDNPIHEGNKLYKKKDEKTFNNVDNAEHFFKSSLNENGRDELMMELEQCSSYLQIFDVIEKAPAICQRHHVQIVLLMWKLITCDNVTSIVHHPALEKYLINMQEHISDMNLSELSYCYLYMRKMEVPNIHPVMSQILIQMLTMVKNEKELIELPILSRLMVAVNTGKDFYIPLVCQHIWPHIIAHLKICNSSEAINLLTICMLHAKRMTCIDTMYTMKQRVQQLLDNGILNENTPKVLIKLIQFFNTPIWSEHNTKLICKLITILHTTLTSLSDNELKSLCQTFNYQLEPAELTDSLRCETETRFKQKCTLDSMVNYIGFAKLTQRLVLVTTLKDFLRSKDVWNEPNASSNFFIALRNLKVSNVYMCNMYWEGVIEELNSSSQSDKLSKFQRHAHNYMNFNNNLGGTYRHDELEKNLCNIAMRLIEGDIASRIPSKFARIAAFVLAYGHTPYSWKKYPNVIISKIISMSSQFSIMDCFKLSRGLQIALELRFRHQSPSLIHMQISVIDNVLITCIENHLNDKDDISISDLNAIVRTLAIRKSTKNSIVYKKALTKYGELDYSRPNCMNSRILRDMTFNFSLSNFLIPKALDAMCDYIENNSTAISGDSVEKLLTLLYNLGYTSVSNSFLNRSIAIILRDFEVMSGLSLMQSCMALCYLNAMPEELINKVFCIKFIQRVEDEIQTCYSKGTYPDRIQHIIMQLNRTVCFDMPEMNVPWFQQNFVAAQLSKTRLSNTPFKQEVKRLLKIIFQGDKFLHCNHTTPYGYQIDFVVYFDRDKKPISIPIDTNMLQHINKVAILLLKLESFCENDFTLLRGVESLKIKHLEMMGYKVLHLSEHDWNSKYMNTIGVKLNYLKSLLKISDI